MLKIDISLLIQIANFLFLLFILNLILYRPIRRIIATRNSKLNSLKQSIEELNEKYQKAKEEFESRRIAVSREAYQEKESLKSEGLNEERKLIDQANGEAAQRLKSAREDISGKIADIRKSLEAEIDNFSRELAEKILGRSV